MCTLSPLAIADLGGCKGRDEGNARGQGNRGQGWGRGGAMRLSPLEVCYKRLAMAAVILEGEWRRVTVAHSVPLLLNCLPRIQQQSARHCLCVSLCSRVSAAAVRAASAAVGRDAGGGGATTRPLAAAYACHSVIYTHPPAGMMTVTRRALLHPLTLQCSECPLQQCSPPTHTAHAALVRSVQGQ